MFHRFSLEIVQVPQTFLLQNLGESMLIPLGPQAGDGIDPLEEQRHLSGEHQ